MKLVLDLAVGAWVAVLVVSLIDALGVWLFWPLSYVVGVRVLKHVDAQLPRPATPLESVFETKNGKYKLVSSERVLVRERYRLFGRRTEARGSITWGPEGALIEARLPVMTLLVAFAITGVTGTMVVLADSPEALGIGVFILGILAFNVFMSRRQMLVLLDEYREWSDSPAAARLTSASS